MRVTRAFRGVAAPHGCVARSGRSRARSVLQGAQRLVGARPLRALGLGQIVAEPRGDAVYGLAAHRQSLARSLQPVEGADRGLARAGRVGELDLGALPLGEHGLEPRLRRASRERGGRSALLRLGAACVERRQVDPCEPCPQRSDLCRELLRALRGRRLQRQRTQTLAHLVLDVAGTLDLGRNAGELQLRPVTAALELPEPGGLLDERAAVLGLRREHGVDLALADDRVHGAAEADVGEQLDEVGSTDGRAVDEVLALAAADEAARDRDLRVVELGAEAAVLVVEEELDLAVVGRLAARGAPEEDVVGLLRAQLRRRQRAGRPDDRVGDVRLAGPVRPDHDRHPGLELHLDRVRERLEAAQLDRAQVHRARTLTAGTDGGTARTPPARGRCQAAGGWTPSAASAPAAASCSAAFFVVPLPVPSCSPSISAAHTNRRSCGGPSTSSTS